MAKKDDRKRYGMRPQDVLRREFIPESPYNAAVGTGSRVPSGPWSRLEGETIKAYFGFDIFRRLGPSRSLEAVKNILYAARQLRLLPTTRPDVLPSEEESRKLIQAVKRETAEGQTSALCRTKSTIAIGKDEKLARRHSNDLINKWAATYNWIERAKAWDDYVFKLMREHEIELRRQDQVEMAATNRVLRRKMLRISMKLLDQVLGQLEAGQSIEPKALRDLVLAAERTGLIRDNAFKGVKDLLDDSDKAGQMDPRIAIRLLDAMTSIAEEHETDGLALPSPDDAVDVESSVRGEQP